MTARRHGGFVRFACFALAASSLVALGASNASATGTRLRSMGAIHGVPTAGMNLTAYPVFAEAWLAYEDEANIFYLPATLTRYGNRVMIDELSGNYAEFGNAYPRARFGFHYNITDFTVLAFYGSNADVSVASTRPFTNAGGPSAGDHTISAGEAGNVDLTADLKGSIVFAHDLGGIRLGMAFNAWGDSLQVEAPAGAVSDISVMVIDFDLGFGLDFTGNNSLDFGLGMKFSTFDATTSQVNEGAPQEITLYEPETNFGIEFNFRGIFNFFQGMQIIPFAQVVFEREGLTDSFPANTTDRPFADSDHFGIEVGVNLKIEPFENVFIYPTLGMRFDLYTVATNVGDIVDDRRFTLPYYGFGLDARIWDWFAFRMGARQFIVFDKNAEVIVTNGGNNESDVRDSDVITTFHTGFGLYFGETDNWIIEAHMSPDFFLNGPNVISGNQTGQFALDAAIKYVW